MKRTLKKWKFFVALTLSVVMVIAGMPMTALAAPDETISPEEDIQPGTISEEDASEGEQTEAGSPEEGTGKDSESEEGNEGEMEKKQGKPPKTAKKS